VARLPTRRAACPGLGTPNRPETPAPTKPPTPKPPKGGDVTFSLGILQRLDNGALFKAKVGARR
jgi:hypothetical protein